MGWPHGSPRARRRDRGPRKPRGRKCDGEPYPQAACWRQTPGSSNALERPAAERPASLGCVSIGALRFGGRLRHRSIPLLASSDPRSGALGRTCWILPHPHGRALALGRSRGLGTGNRDWHRHQCGSERPGYGRSDRGHRATSRRATVAAWHRTRRRRQSPFRTRRIGGPGRAYTPSPTGGNTPRARARRSERRSERTSRTSRQHARSQSARSIRR